MCLLYLPVFPSVYFPHQLFTKKEIPIHFSHITSGKAGGLKPLEPLKGAKKTKTSQLGML
jgi:hypothetical protein